MKRSTAVRLAWSLWAVSAGMLVGALILGSVAGFPAGELFFMILFPLFIMAYATVGLLVASRQPGNAIGWVFLATALAWSLSAVATEVGRLAAHGRIPVTEWVLFADWLGAWLFIPWIYLPVIFLLLLFPDGRLPSRRWLPVAWISVVAITVVAVDTAFAPGPMEDASVLRTNPYAIPLPPGWAAVSMVAFMLSIAAAVASAVALVRRFRRSSGDRRRQMKWLAYAGAVLAAIFLLSGISFGVVPDSTIADLVIPAVIISGLAMLPVAAGIAILKHRLYDIDIVIRKTVVFGALVAFSTLVYVAVVVGLGALIGGTRSSPVLTIAAAAVIAVAFQPVRARARRLANRLVYGKRATPYEVLSEFSDRVAASYAADDVLPRMARLVGEGTGAREAGVWLRVGGELRPAATWPPDRPPRSAVRLDGESVPVIPGVDRSYPVLHRGELLGALTVVKPPAEPPTREEEQLLSDLAAQAGLVLRNVRLIEELRASRQRLVAAQDEERRRLERNIHDGAQQQLVALAVKLRLAETLTERDPAKARGMVAEARRESQEALDELRDLARGIYPPLLADRGLDAAVEAQARKAAIPVEVESDGVRRYPQEAEAAVYFSVLEALQNAAKYAGARRGTVRLSQDDGHLVFVVEDNGRGFDPSTTPPGSGLQNMRDRLEALGGTLEVRSAPGDGTTITGRIPVEEGVASPRTRGRT